MPASKSTDEEGGKSAAGEKGSTPPDTQPTTPPASVVPPPEPSLGITLDKQLALIATLIALVAALQKAIESVIANPTYALAAAFAIGWVVLLLLWRLRKKPWLARFGKIVAKAPRFLGLAVVAVAVISSLYLVCTTEFWYLARSTLCGPRVILVVSNDVARSGWSSNLCDSEVWPTKPLAATLLVTFILSFATCLWLLVSRFLLSALHTRKGRIGSHRLLVRSLSVLVFVASLAGVARGTGAGLTLVRSQARSSGEHDDVAVGINLPWLHYGHDFGAVNGWEWQGVSQNDATLRQHLGALKAARVDYVTWFLFGDGRASPEWDARGYPSKLDERFWRDYDRTIELVREVDIGIVWVVLDFKALKPEETENGVKLFGHADLVRESAKRDAFMARLREVVRRYPRERNIVGWITMNEPELAIQAGHAREEDLIDFLRTGADVIRGETGGRQPVSVGHLDLVSLVRYERSPGLSDFLVFHHYDAAFPPSAQYIRHLLGGDGPPDQRAIYVGEFDPKEPPGMGAAFPTWVAAAGYAGTWPWSLVTPPQPSPCPDNRCIDVIQWAMDVRSGASSRLTSAFEQRLEKRLPEGARQIWSEEASRALDFAKQKEAALRDSIAAKTAERDEHVKRRESARKILDEQAVLESNAKALLTKAEKGIVDNATSIEKDRAKEKAMLEQLLTKARTNLEQAIQVRDAKWENRERGHIEDLTGKLTKNAKDTSDAEQSLKTWAVARDNAKAELAAAQAQIKMQTEQRAKELVLVRALEGELDAAKGRLELWNKIYLQFWRRETEVLVGQR